MKLRGARTFPESPRHPPIEHLIIRLGPHEFALPAALVRHLSTQPDLLPIPNGPAWFAGMLALPGQAAPAIDLRIRFGFPAIKPFSAIAIDAPAFLAGFPWIAFLADKILDTASFPISDISPLGQMARPFRPFLAGSWRGRSRVCYVLNPQSLLTPDEFPALHGVMKKFL